MRRLIGLMLCAALFIAARNPSPGDPQGTYVDDVPTAVQAANADATVSFKLNPRVTSPGYFWLGVELNTTGNPVFLSGSIFYDSLLVRPSGRMYDYYGYTTVNSITDGNTLPVGCGLLSGTNKAAIQGITWYNYPTGQLPSEATGPLYYIEFQAFSTGNAVFDWVSPDVNCVEATQADRDIDYKPSGAIWKLNGLYYATSAVDTANYRVVSDTIVVQGTARDSTYFWPDNPGYYQSYLGFGDGSGGIADTVTASVGDTIVVPVDLWSANYTRLDSTLVSVAWNRNALSFVDTYGGSHFNFAQNRLDSIGWNSIYASDTTITAVCGVDSPDTRGFWARTQSGGGPVFGTIMNIRFTVDRADTSRIAFSCGLPTGSPAINEASFPRNTFAYKGHDSYYTAPRYVDPLFPFEKPQTHWRWRYGESSPLVVIGQ